MRAEFRARARVAALPHVGLFDIRINYGNVVAEPMCDFYSINVPLGPGIEWRIGSKVEAGGSGGIRVGVPGEEFNLRFHHAAPVLVANIDARAVHDAASEAGFSHDARREISLSCPEGAALFRVLTIQWRDALRAGRVPANDTDLGDIEQRLIEAFVAAAFPDTNPLPSSAEATRIMSAAEAFVRMELSGPLTVDKIACASDTSNRTLHRVFLHAAGVSPMVYVTRERLNAARRRLLAAERGTLTVRQAATECGFAHHGRFSILYREVFGESPSETLCHWE